MVTLRLTAVRDVSSIVCNFNNQLNHYSSFIDAEMSYFCQNWSVVRIPCIKLFVLFYEFCVELKSQHSPSVTDFLGDKLLTSL